jgi:hypothetical protein
MSKTSRQLQIDTSRSVAASGYSAAIDVARDDGYTLQTVFTGLATGASGTLTLQTSIDGTNFANYTSGNQNFASGTSTILWEVVTKRHKWVRLALTANTAGTGTCTTTYYGEVFND